MRRASRISKFSGRRLSSRKSRGSKSVARHHRVERLEARNLLAADLSPVPPAMDHPDDLLPHSFGAQGEQVGNTLSDSGGFEGSQERLMLSGNGGGTVDYQYEHFTIPDNFILRYEGKNLFETGFTGGSRSGSVQVPAGNANFVDVIVATNDSGTAWNYTVSAQSCGDTGLLSVEAGSGDFEASTDSDGNLVCSANGTVYVGLQNGDGRMLRFENVDAVYDDENLTLTGGTAYSELTPTDGPLFQSDVVFGLQDPTASVSEANRSDDFAIGGLETEFTGVTLKSDGIYLTGGFSLPQSKLLIGLTPSDLQIDLTGKDQLVISDRGIGFGSDVGTTAFPTTKLFSLHNLLGITNTGAKIQYVNQDATGTVNQLKIQGKFEIRDLKFVELADKAKPFRATLDLTDDAVAGREGSIKIENGVADLKGELKLEEIPLPFGFKIDEMFLRLETNNGQLVDVNGGAKVELPLRGNIPFPPNPTIFAEVGFKKIADEWRLDDIVLELDNLNVPIPTTPLFWQRIQGGVRNLAPDTVPTSYLGGLGFSGGPARVFDVASWLPFDDFTASLLRVDGNLESDGRRFDGDGTVLVLSDKILEFKGRLTLDLDKQTLRIPATVKALSGVIDGSLDLQVDYGKYSGSAAGQVSLKFPDSRIFFGLRNKELTNSAAQVVLSFDDNPSNDYIAAWRSVSIPLIGSKVFGLQYFMDGDYRIIGNSNVPVTGSFTVEPNTEYLMMTADWENAFAQDVPVRVIDPQGNSIAESEFASRGIAIVPNLSSEYAKTVVVANPTPGIWDLEVIDDTGLTDVQYSAQRDSQTPEIQTLTATAQSGSNDVLIAYDVIDSDSTAEISFYLDDNDVGFDGSILVSGIAEEDGSGSYTLDTTGLAPGQYHVYALVQDETNAPVRQYATEVIDVQGGADLSVEVTTEKSDFDEDEDATFDIAIANGSAQQVVGSKLMLSFSQEVTLSNQSEIAPGQTGTEFEIDLGTLDAGSTQNLTLILAADPTLSRIELNASISDAEYDSDATNNLDSLVVTFSAPIADADLELSVTQLPSSVSVGETFQYELTVVNTGSSVATDTVLRETYSSALQPIDAESDDGLASISGRELVVDFGDLAPGASVSVLVTVRATAAGNVFTSSRVETSAGDVATIDNTTVVRNAIAAAVPSAADLSLMVSVSDDGPAINDVVEITVTLTNSGPGVASGILVNVPVPSGMQFESFSAIQGSYDDATGVWDVGNVRDNLSRSLSIQARAVQSGSFGWTAEVVSVNEQDPDSTPGNSLDSEDDFGSVDVIVGIQSRIYSSTVVSRPYFIPGDGVPTAIIFQAVETATVSVIPIGTTSFSDEIQILDSQLNVISGLTDGIVTATVQPDQLYAITFAALDSDRFIYVHSSAGQASLSPAATTNILQRTDTTADGHTTPADALVVLNEIDRQSRAGRLQGESAIQSRYLYDVNQDGVVSPLDALIVLNRLGQQATSSRASGERAHSDFLPTRTTDLVFAQRVDDELESDFLLGRSRDLETNDTLATFFDSSEQPIANGNHDEVDTFFSNAETSSAEDLWQEDMLSSIGV